MCEIESTNVFHRTFMIRLILINEVRQILRKKLDFLKLTETRSKVFQLQEAIWSTVINEIFELPSRLGPFCQTKYFFDLSSS